ncbi:MAG: hypothetical protein K0U74_02465 [Alphaproteobacteria bacterium]|nr:hypothetical protein [Alphaproteobacteria bacterium]
MKVGSQGFHSYNKNLSRIYWLELIDEQIRQQNREKLRLSIVARPCLIEGEDDADCEDDKRELVAAS